MVPAANVIGVAVSRPPAHQPRRQRNRSFHRDRHGGDVAVRSAVVGVVGEAVSPTETRVRRVSERSVRNEGQRPVRRGAVQDHCERIDVWVAVVSQHAGSRHIENGTGIHCVTVILRHRWLWLNKLESTHVHGGRTVPVAIHRPHHATLVCERSPGVVACVDARAARQEGVRFRWSVVVLQRAQQRIDGARAVADLIAVDPVGKTAGRANVTKQVVAQRGEDAAYIGIGR